MFFTCFAPLLLFSNPLTDVSIERACSSAPVLFLIFGPNGAGKTTSPAKLAPSKLGRQALFPLSVLV